jgi:O2-independent ubiquinone biosynthesis accessory factor UbiT
MNPGASSLHEPEFAALPMALRKPARHLRSLVRRLPTQPPSFVAARLLDRLLWPRLDATQRRMLAGRTVEVELLEPGLRLRLRLGAGGFEVAPAGAPDLVIRARSAALLRLARGQDDADRLFFERALVMEGDTEFGLMIKNTLDAIGPLWAGSTG